MSVQERAAKQVELVVFALDSWSWVGFCFIWSVGALRSQFNDVSAHELRQFSAE